MIWKWLKLALVWLLRLLIPSPYPTPGRISPNRACTVCGNRGGVLRFDWYLQANSHMDKRPMVFFSCATCGCVEAFKPIGVPQYPVDFSLQSPEQAKAAGA